MQTISDELLENADLVGGRYPPRGRMGFVGQVLSLGDQRYLLWGRDCDMMRFRATEANVLTEAAFHTLRALAKTVALPRMICWALLRLTHNTGEQLL